MITSVKLGFSSQRIDQLQIIFIPVYYLDEKPTENISLGVKKKKKVMAAFKNIFWKKSKFVSE